MKKLIVAFVAIALAAAAVAAQADGLEAMVAKDLARPVRAGGEEGRPFWNRYSLQFMYPPAFDLKTVEGAVDLPVIYPSKMNSALVQAMLHYVRRCPERREAALATARRTTLGDVVCGSNQWREFWGQSPREFLDEFRTQIMHFSSSYCNKTYSLLQ